MGVQGTVENIVCALSDIVGKPCDVCIDKGPTFRLLALG